MLSDLTTKYFQAKRFSKGSKKRILPLEEEWVSNPQWISTILRDRSTYHLTLECFFKKIMDIVYLHSEFNFGIMLVLSLAAALFFCNCPFPPDIQWILHWIHWDYFSSLFPNQYQSYGWLKYRQGDWIHHLITRWPEPLQFIVYCSCFSLALFSR